MKILQEIQPQLSVFFVIESPEQPSPPFGGMLAYHGSLDEWGNYLKITVHKNGAYDKQIDTRNLEIEDTWSPEHLFMRFQTFCHADAVARVTSKT